MSTQEIAIRSIQHYLYCPHRWGLLEIDKAWSENVFVTKANLLHKRVHDVDRSYTSRGKRVYTAVPVYNDREEYNLYGVTDCLELTEDANGIQIDGTEKRYQLCIVEYKPTKPKYQDYYNEDLMQVFAQKLCVDYVFGCDSSAVLYYANEKKRVPLPVKENYQEYDATLKKLLQEMRISLEKGSIPSIRKGQKCNGCSMKDMCMPTISGKKSFQLLLQEISNTDMGDEDQQ